MSITRCSSAVSSRRMNGTTMCENPKNSALRKRLFKTVWIKKHIKVTSKNPPIHPALTSSGRKDSKSMMFNFSRESPSFVNFCNCVSSANRLICIFFYRLTSFAFIIQHFAIFSIWCGEFLEVTYKQAILISKLLETVRIQLAEYAPTNA